jgi:hypothetical protein
VTSLRREQANGGRYVDVRGWEVDFLWREQRPWRQLTEEPEVVVATIAAALATAA